MNFCTNCGNRVEDGEKFCVNCGASLEPGNSVLPHDEPSSPNKSSFDASGQSSDTSEKAGDAQDDGKQKTSSLASFGNRTIILVSIAALVFLVAAFVVMSKRSVYARLASLLLGRPVFVEGTTGEVAEFFRCHPGFIPRERQLRTQVDEKTISLPTGVNLVLRAVPGGLWFGKYEVTQAQWEAVMENNPSLFKGADRPVENVSWFDCQKFLKHFNALPAAKESGLTFRLPTEDEWRNACRADASGELAELATFDEVAWFEDNSDYTTHPVGQKKPNAFGLYDMHGNVWELTDSAVGEERVFRGGSWFHSAGCCVSSCRSWGSPSYRNFFLGFRLCASGKTD